MKDRKHSLPWNQVSLGLSAALLFTLTGCVAYVDRPAQGSVYIAPPVEPVVFVEDDYVYYPGYEVYYSSRRHQYAYRDGNAWVARSAPHGVSVNVLLASHSVRMNFHDSPAQHHAAMVQQYPRNWKPPGANQGHNPNDNQRDGGKDNQRR